MYGGIGGMRMSETVIRGYGGGDKVSSGSATVASLSGDRSSSLRVETDVVADPSPFGVRWSASCGKTLQPEPTTCRDQRLRGTRKELEMIADSY